MLAGKLSCYFWCKESNLPHLSLVTKAVVSLLTAQLAIIKAVELGAWGEWKGEYNGDCVCVRGGTCASVCAGWKEGRGCESRGAALGKVVNCLLTASLQAWGLAFVKVWPGLSPAPSSPLPRYLHPQPPGPPQQILLCPFLPSAAPSVPGASPHRSAFWSLELVRQSCGVVGRQSCGVVGRQLTRVKSAALQGRELCWGCRSLGHHCSLSQLEAVTLY